MTSVLRRKRANSESNVLDAQTEYENSIRNDDMETFLRLYESKNVAAASVVALRWASAAKKNAYLEKIKLKMQPNDLRQLISICQAFGASGGTEQISAPQEVGAEKQGNDASKQSVAPATAAPMKKAKISQQPTGNSGGGDDAAKQTSLGGTSATTIDAPIDKMVRQWPFQVARVAWNDVYKTRASCDKPLEVREAQTKWQELVEIAKNFVALATQKPVLPATTATIKTMAAAATATATVPNSLQEQLFERLEAAARVEKAVQRGQDESLESKFINCRQTARMVFSRILFIEQMNFVVLRRDAAGADKGTKLDFFQLLKNYAVPIPPASSFKGKASNFASQFQQHLNTSVFDQKDCFVASVEFVHSQPLDE